MSARFPKILPLLYYNLGIIYLKNNNIKNALQSFHVSIEKNETNPGNDFVLARSMAFFQIGLLQLEKFKEYRKSTQAFHEALCTYEDSYTGEERYDYISKINNNLGVSYAHRKKYDKAYRFLNSALSINRIIAQKKKLNDDETQALALVELEIADVSCNMLSVICEMDEKYYSHELSDPLKIIHSLEEAKNVSACGFYEAATISSIQLYLRYKFCRYEGNILENTLVDIKNLFQCGI